MRATLVSAMLSGVSVSLERSSGACDNGKGQTQDKINISLQIQ